MKNAQQIISRVAVTFGVEPAAICVGPRTKPLIEARQAAAFVLFFQERMTYSDIARELGYRDHTAARWAVDAAAQRAKARQSYSDKITAIGRM